MQEIIRLIKIDHDNMENRDAVYTTNLGTFVNGNGLSAHGKVAKFISEMLPEKRYLGWDGNVYPQYIIEKEYLI